LLTLENKNTVDHCLFMLVHSALANVKKQLLILIILLVNAEISINKD